MLVRDGRATCALDTMTTKAWLIMPSIAWRKAARRNRKVTPRLTTVLAMPFSPRTLVSDHGRIAEIGSHDALIDHEGRYAALAAAA